MVAEMDQPTETNCWWKNSEESRSDKVHLHARYPAYDQVLEYPAWSIISCF